MGRFLARRAAMLLSALLGVSLLTFAMVHLVPGDPVLVLAGERGLSPQRHAEMLHALGLDRPLAVQYLDYLGHVIRGDLGRSMATRTPVLAEFGARFPATLELSLAAMVLALGLGLPLGVLAARYRGRLVDQLVQGIGLVGYSMPIFWWGLLLIVVVAVGWRLTPVSGRLDPSFWIDSHTGLMLVDTLLDGDMDAFVDALHHLVLPAVVLATVPLAVLVRMTRSAMLEVMQKPFVRTARAKGLAPWRVLVVHTLRNALIPVVTVAGLQVGVMLAGAVLTETIFSWPGVGKWLVDAIARRDYPVIQGGVLLIAAVIILVNLVVDACYGHIDPTIRAA